MVPLAALQPWGKVFRGVFTAGQFSSLRASHHHCCDRRDARCDWIPVDVAINLSLVVGWKTATEPRSSSCKLNITQSYQTGSMSLIFCLLGIRRGL